MPTYEREKQYIRLLSEQDRSVKELADLLFISEPTVRRDIVHMRLKELVECTRGMVRLKTDSPDKRIPLFVRNLEEPEKKHAIAAKAAKLIHDGFVIMLDASTTTYSILPFLADFKNLLVITSGAKTAVALAAMGIRTICTGGELTLESLSYIGADAERTLQSYNADIAFFSCRGLTEDGLATDTSIAENAVRRIMICNSARSYLLSDSGKLGKRYLHTLCKKEDITGILTD